MFIYAGIDEAGYGPMFGPLLVSRAVFALNAPPGSQGQENAASGGADTPSGGATPDMWHALRKAVCRRRSQGKGRLVINDSKKVYTPSQGIKHLELGVLSFAALGGMRVATVDQWLDALGEECHRDLGASPWYAPTDEHPWGGLPAGCTAGEAAVARNLLLTTANRAGVRVLDLGAAVVFEDRFNRMVSATRSKAAASFTFVAAHLASIWQRFGEASPTVVVDRQSGRMHYRELLATALPGASLTILDEDSACSAYRAEQPGRSARRMTVRFEVEADARHLPVALASMTAKYTRELLMARFQTWFADRAPHIKPTRGYAGDAKRFWAEVEPLLADWAIEPAQLRRSC